MRVIVAILFLTSPLAVGLCAQQPPSVNVPSRIVATIDGQPVSAGDVERELAEAYRGRKLNDSERQALLTRARDQVIDRRLVLQRLVQASEAATEADVNFELAKLEKQQAAVGKTLSDHAKQLGMTPDEVRQTIVWRLSWQKYLARQQTDENLQKYFDQHRRDFDGTELKVAHILIKRAGNDDAALAAAIAKAEEIRMAIDRGQITFAEAARKHSAGPSAKDGGDIGWIKRHEPMPEPFSATAFALNAGQVSAPVQTTFGIHLIQVLEVKAGTRTWQDVAETLRPAVALYLFRWLADKERATARVELVEGWP
jgi:peptidyl-prolyl cis-trans isomerase SurA